MSNDVKWLKLMNTMFEDEKIEYIQSLPDGEMVLLIWIRILCLASKSNEDGRLMVTTELPYTVALMAHKFKKSNTQIEYALGVMQKLGMIEIIDDVICVSNWCKYQSTDELAKIREQTRLRVEKFREKKRKKELEEGCSVTVTLNCNENALISNTLSSKHYVCDEIISKYNTICTNLSKVLKKTPKREKAIKSFLKEMTVEEFENACKMANETDFLVGKNEKGWRADFDFIIKQDNAIKILEGKYSKGNSLKTQDNKNEYYFNDIVNI
jgi:predicted phage replisome organizer